MRVTGCLGKDAPGGGPAQDTACGNRAWINSFTPLPASTVTNAVSPAFASTSLLPTDQNTNIANAIERMSDLSNLRVAFPALISPKTSAAASPPRAARAARAARRLESTLATP